MLLEVPHHLGDTLAHQVVAQVHEDGVAVGERHGQLEGVSESVGTLLHDELGIDAESGPVSDGVADLLAGLGRDDDGNVGDAGFGEVIQPVEQDWLVGDRHELLGHGKGDRPQPAACPSGQHNAFHRFSLSGRHQSSRERYQSIVSPSRSSRLWAGCQPSARILEESTA